MVVRMKLRSRLGEIIADPSEVLPLLARFLSVDEQSMTSETNETSSLPDLENRTHDAYAAWIAALAEDGPLVVAIQDVHEADRSTRSLAEALLPVTDRAPLLLVFTARPTNGTEGWRLLQGILAEYRHRTVTSSWSRCRRSRPVCSWTRSRRRGNLMTRRRPISSRELEAIHSSPRSYSGC